MLPTGADGCWRRAVSCAVGRGGARANGEAGMQARPPMRRHPDGGPDDGARTVVPGRGCPDDGADAMACPGQAGCPATGAAVMGAGPTRRWTTGFSSGVGAGRPRELRPDGRVSWLTVSVSLGVIAARLPGWFDRTTTRAGDRDRLMDHHSVVDRRGCVSDVPVTATKDTSDVSRLACSEAHNRFRRQERRRSAGAVDQQSATKPRSFSGGISCPSPPCSPAWPTTAPARPR